MLSSAERVPKVDLTRLFIKVVIFDCTNTSVLLERSSSSKLLIIAWAAVSKGWCLKYGAKLQYYKVWILNQYHNQYGTKLKIQSSATCSDTDRNITYTWRGCSLFKAEFLHSVFHKSRLSASQVDSEKKGWAVTFVAYSMPCLKRSWIIMNRSSEWPVISSEALSRQIFQGSAVAALHHQASRLSMWNTFRDENWLNQW